MDQRELNQMFEQLVPTPEQMQRGLNRLLQEKVNGVHKDERIHHFKETA